VNKPPKGVIVIPLFYKKEARNSKILNIKIEQSSTRSITKKRHYCPLLHHCKCKDKNIIPKKENYETPMSINLREP